MKHGVRNTLLFWLSGFLRCRCIKLDGQPYMERYKLFEVFGVRFQLHRWLQPDSGRGVHTHPWHWCLAIPLCGGYWEERLVGYSPAAGLHIERCYRGALWPNWINRLDAHRVCVLKRRTWTLFITSPRVVGKHNGWGELVSEGVLKKQLLTFTPVDTAADHTWWNLALTGNRCQRAPLGFGESNERDQLFVDPLSQPYNKPAEED